MGAASWWRLNVWVLAGACGSAGCFVPWLQGAFATRVPGSCPRARRQRSVSFGAATTNDVPASLPACGVGRGQGSRVCPRVVWVVEVVQAVFGREAYTP